MMKIIDLLYILLNNLRNYFNSRTKREIYILCPILHYYNLSSVLMINLKIFPIFDWKHREFHIYMMLDDGRQECVHDTERASGRSSLHMQYEK